ncbi:MBL fold metallo-hydrolase [uncultured Ilyobacter sp.]|uniref:MBL fold metallo-hydrolase n=1 Tax=uncultured Ilyobacter sp. TaxID=544433 RepID=UPI002AA92E41|nr:MBL fold metallo-hydrolase [uncultured Ilyobacter sp.]
MLIKVLVENNSGDLCKGEKGLSLYIEADNKKILLDTGETSLFLENASKLNVTLNDLDFVVLSHGHFDHGDGLRFIKNKKLICHPDSFKRRFRKRDSSYLGLHMDLERANSKFDLTITREPYKLSENITFLGEIPRENNFESKNTPFKFENGEDDFVLDDSALVINSEKGLIVIPGCSHSGICNIISYAKKVTGVDNVYAVIGGLHLMNLDNATYKAIDFLKKENISIFYPIHCTKKIVADEISKLLINTLVKRSFSGDTISL